MFRSRVVLAIIGVIVIGGTSAAVALLSGTNTSSLATTTTPPAMATGGPATRTPILTSGTTASGAPTAATSGAAPSGQIIDLHGTITSVDTGNNQLTLKDTSGTTWTVQVAANTTYEGASQTFGGLRTGMVAEVSGVVKGGTTFLAYHIHADI